MNNKLQRFPKARTLALGVAVLTLSALPGSLHAQSTMTQDQDRGAQERQAGPGDDITRRDLARFDQFLDSHHEISDQLRKTPSLVDDPQYLQRNPDLSTYLQDHPGVKQEISQQPDTFLRLEDNWGRDHGMRDRDAGGQDRDADRRGPVDQDRDVDRGRGREDFDRFLDQHREIGEQVRKNPALCNDRNFVNGHPELQAYLAQNPEVRDQLRQNPNGYMQRPDNFNREVSMRDRDMSEQNRDRDADRRGSEEFNRFLDQHREVGEQVRKNPSLLNDRNFVSSHPELEAYLSQNPGVRDQLRQNAGGFMQQADNNNRNMGTGDRDPMHNHMADFGGFLGNHSDIQTDLDKNPNALKDHKWVENHGELNNYLKAHPEVQAEIMADPQGFVHGAQQYNKPGTPAPASPSGAGVSEHGTGTGAGTGTGTGTGATGTPTGTPGTGSSTGTSTNPTNRKPK